MVTKRKITMEKQIDPNILTLYRYFGYAAHMRDLFRKEVNPDWIQLMSKDFTGIMLFFYSAPGLYLLYSYSGIFLVIEGWRDLKLSDERIDSLVASPYVDRLRLFRNATFHYQKEPISFKHLQFFGTEEEATEKWLNELYREFERFFRDNTLPIPEELKAELKDKNHVELAKTIQKHWMKIEGFGNSWNGSIEKT